VGDILAREMDLDNSLYKQDGWFICFTLIDILMSIL
jgi:hypothetical protein